MIAKYLRVLVFISLAVYSQQNLMEMMQRNKCPEIKSMANLDIKKLAGVWYPIEVDSTSFIPGTACYKVTFNMVDASKINALDELYNLATMSYENFTVKLDISQSLNSLTTIQKFPYQNMFGQTEMRDTKLETFVVNTDYTTFMAGMGCVESVSFWDPNPHMFYFVATRDRNFDSLRTLVSIFGLIPNRIDYNTVVFPYQGPNCKN